MDSKDVKNLSKIRILPPLHLREATLLVVPASIAGQTKENGNGIRR
jgi:hypothetical protein